MDRETLTRMASHWDARASREAGREQEDPAKVVHTDLLRRMIARHTRWPHARILDAGAGTGRYSLPLAAAGHLVTHLDISKEMLAIAQEAANRQGLQLSFVQGTITDLSGFADRGFDLVVCVDSPISFCHREYRGALDELTRVSASAILFSVMNRTSVIMAGGVDFDLMHFGEPKTVVDVYRTGNLEVTEALLKLQDLMPSWHAFTAQELRREVEGRGFSAVELQATGALSLLVKKELLRKATESPEYGKYLAFEEEFDADENASGLGYTHGSGLTIAAVRNGQ